MTYTDDQLKDLLNGIYAGEITEYNIPEDLYFAISDYLKSGLYDGFGGSLVDFSGKDLELLTELRENIYMFSGAKSYQQLIDIRSMMFDENGELVGQREFNRLGAQVFDKWNNAWGSSEYNTAQATGTMAVKWNEIEANKDLLPVLQYQTIGDACDICAPLDGMTAPVDDSIWDSVYAPNHFNCLCIVTQHEEKELKLTPNSEKMSTFEQVTAEMDDSFKMNAGKDGYVFSPDHPYFDVKPKDKEYAKNNFNLPIPNASTESKEPLTGLNLKTAKEIMSDYPASDIEKQAIKKYTEGNYSRINGYLRGVVKNVSEENEKIIHDIDKFLTSAPKLTETSYRGVTLDESNWVSFKNLKKGESFTDKGFLSTSYSKDVATKFSGSSRYQAEFTIKGKSGVLIENLSDAKKEGEILFNKKTEFRIESVKVLEKKGITGKAIISLIEI